MWYINGTRLDDRIIRTDWDAGFIEGRQYGRGKSGGQVRTSRLFLINDLRLMPSWLWHPFHNGLAVKVTLSAQMYLVRPSRQNVGVIYHFIVWLAPWWSPFCVVIGYLSGQDGAILSTRDYLLSLSSLEAAFLLVSTKNRNLWERPTLGVCNSLTFPSLCSWSESSLTIWLAENMEWLLCTCSETWTFAEVAILGSGQKECRLWGQGPVSCKKNFYHKSHVLNPWLTKLVQSRCLDIGLILFFCEFMDTDKSGPSTL